MIDTSGIRFHVTRLCGGQDLLLTPDKKIPIDLDRVYIEMKSQYARGPKDCVKFDWNGIMMTVYPAGSMLFGFFNNRLKAEEYAREILKEIAREEDETKIGFIDEKI